MPENLNVQVCSIIVFYSTYARHKIFARCVERTQGQLSLRPFKKSVRDNKSTLHEPQCQVNRGLKQASKNGSHG